MQTFKDEFVKSQVSFMTFMELSSVVKVLLVIPSSVFGSLQLLPPPKRLAILHLTRESEGIHTFLCASLVLFFS